MAAGVAVTVRRACGREEEDQFRKFVRQVIRVIELWWFWVSFLFFPLGWGWYWGRGYGRSQGRGGEVKVGGGVGKGN
jgi:hypothetical protein